MHRTPESKRWEIARRIPDEIMVGIREAANLGDVPDLIVQLLYNRGVTAPRDVRDFLADEPPPLGDPFLLKDIERAVARVTAAIDRNEVMAVYGDFDVDGITSVALLDEILTSLGARVVTYIPSRADEGYGLHRKAIEMLGEQGVKLVITVDCGIAAGSEVAFARAIGLDVVVTDHHQVSGPVPDACAVINPRQPNCPYPCKDLAGVGVAFKLAQALLQRRKPVGGDCPEHMETKLLDLVALGTIADVVPLLGENRTLVRLGLAALNATHRLGLQEMAVRAGLKLGSITPTAVGYVLAPRLNAAGRLADAHQSYRLLTTTSPREARELADYLETMNAERQRLTSEALARAREEIVQMDTDVGVFVLARADYPAGVVGLVAGKLVEEHYRPVVVIEVGAEESRGSARSIWELDITKALADCSDLLTKFGGHAQAAGFTIPTHNLDIFKRRLLHSVRDQLAGLVLQPKIVIDAELSLSQLNWSLFNAINSLAPFGAGNPNPVFLSRRLRLVECRPVGREQPKHLRLRLYDGRRHWTAWGFNMGEEVERLSPGITIDVVYSIVPNDWNGTTSLDLQLKAWRPFDCHS